MTKPMKDIGRMTIKRLKYRYGESGGEDKDAEEELRRRGLTDRQICGVIYGYRQGEYSPRKKPKGKPGGKVANPRPPDDSKPAKVAGGPPIIRHGPYKGKPLTEVPTGYLAWSYGSFSRAKDRRIIGAELRSRGHDDEDLEYFKKKFPCKGKVPERQGGTDESDIEVEHPE